MSRYSERKFYVCKQDINVAFEKQWSMEKKINIEEITAKYRIK